MLDSLTRWELQEVLMEVWSRTKVTAICVTHDVDEAILLADRVVMMTNGPQATIGKITKVDLPARAPARLCFNTPIIMPTGRRFSTSLRSTNMARSQRHQPKIHRSGVTR